MSVTLKSIFFIFSIFKVQYLWKTRKGLAEKKKVEVVGVRRFAGVPVIQLKIH